MIDIVGRSLNPYRDSHVGLYRCGNAADDLRMLPNLRSGQLSFSTGLSAECHVGTYEIKLQRIRTGLLHTACESAPSLQVVAGPSDVSKHRQSCRLFCVIHQLGTLFQAVAPVAWIEAVHPPDGVHPAISLYRLRQHRQFCAHTACSAVLRAPDQIRGIRKRT